MNKNKDLRTLEERATDLEKVITFNIINSIRRNYKSIDEFRRVYSAILKGTAGSAEQIKFCSLFGFKRENQRRILGYETVDGKMRYISLKDVSPYFSKWFHYQRHFNRNYKSGKTFAVHGYFYIDFSVLERWYNYEKILDTNSDFYNHRQHTMIDALVLNSFIKDEEITMTKAQEKQYIKEYEEGKHMLTLEQYKREEAKKRRRDDKRRLTIAKKAARETLAEMAQMQVRIQQLEAENNRLKQLKDLNSDIEDEFSDEDNMQSEIPADWNTYEHEGQKTRSDGSRLHRKCLPGLWMSQVQYAAFCKGEIDEDDFENLWTGYTMTEAEAEAAREECRVLNAELDNLLANGIY